METNKAYSAYDLEKELMETNPEMEPDMVTNIKRTMEDTIEEERKTE